MSSNRLILVGAISMPHGIRGEVIVKSFTNPPENIINLPIVDKDNIPIRLEMAGVTKAGLICSVNQCFSRNEAEKLRKTPLYCERQNMPAIEDQDEFYIEDLKNLKVMDLSNEEIGHIENILNYGAGDIVEIKFKQKKQTELFPFTKDVFPRIEPDHVVIDVSKIIW